VFRTTLVLILFAHALPAVSPALPEETIVRNSVQANERDWQAAPAWSYTETVKDRTGSKTYDVAMIEGSPYRRLLKVNGVALSVKAQQREEQKFQAEAAKRRAQSRSARAKRIAAYEKDRSHDHVLMQQLTNAFTFQLVGQEKLSKRDVYHLRAVTRKGYKPPNMDSRVLTGMKGDLWIDTQSFQWVKARAEVINRVHMEGFLATVDPGTFFELEKLPVTPQIWLPSHFRVQSHSKILGVFSHQTYEDDTWSDYRRNSEVR
jgi:hypothetical protein